MLRNATWRAFRARPRGAPRVTATHLRALSKRPDLARKKCIRRLLRAAAESAAAGVSIELERPANGAVAKAIAAISWPGHRTRQPDASHARRDARAMWSSVWFRGGWSYFLGFLVLEIAEDVVHLRRFSAQVLHVRRRTWISCRKQVSRR